MKICTVSQMRAMDNAAFKHYAVPEVLLMENAGLASCDVIMKQCGIPGKAFIVIAGIGNNGGDGFVVARKIHSLGGRVKVHICGDARKYRGSAQVNLDIIRKLPIEVSEGSSAKQLKKDMADSDIIIDALFGTGLARNVEGTYKGLIDLINSSGKTVISLDIPSGIHGDTGQIMGAAVKAHHTITFGLPKAGNLLLPGFAHCGSLYVTHISFPEELYSSDSLTIAVNAPTPLPPRNPDGHKGDFGDVLFIAGARGYYGAPYFAALSFLKAGGGYSRLAAPETITPVIASKGSEIVFLPQKETTSGSISLSNRAALLDISGKMDFVVLGPGLSLDDETSRLIQELALQIRKPLLIDGDGLTAVSKNLDCIRKRKAPTVLTPHLGEMARLTGLSVKALEQDRIASLRYAAAELNAFMVLKGAHSLIGYPDGKVFVNLSGNSGMASAGSGDVLTGTIAAMYGLGLPLDNAVRNGVFMHGASGDLAAREKGEDGITAQDILDYLPEAMNLSRQGGLAKQYSLQVVL